MKLLNTKSVKILSLALFMGSLVLVSCKKETIETTSSSFLSVEKKNSSFLVKQTGTWCPPCGGWGFTTFQNHIDAYGDTEVLGACVSGGMGGGNNEEIFDAFGTAFDINATPTFHGNFGQTISGALISEHANSPVVVNANYQLTFEGDKMKIKTTTEFFQDVTGDYYLTPYIIVDNIVANQSGHPDGANTKHKKSIMDVARINGVDNPEYFGYKVAAGTIRAGYKVNLEFEADKLSNWVNDDISIGLVITQRDSNGKPTFVNAYTKH